MTTQIPSKGRKVARYYWNHVRAYKRACLGILLAVPFTVAVNNYLPALIAADVLSKLGRHAYSHSVWSSFGPELVLYVVLAFIGMFTWRLVDHFVWRLEANIQRDIAEEVFAHLTAQSANFHANNFSGSLVSQTNKLIGGYIRIADTTIFQVIPLSVGVLMAAIILMPRAPIFALLLVIFAIGYILSSLRLVRPVQKLGAIHAANESRQTGFLADAIANVLVIKSFSNSSYEKKRYAEAARTTLDSLDQVATSHRTLMNYLGSMSRTITGLSLVLATISVVSFGANIGTVFLILSYTATITNELFTFGNNSLRSYNRAIGDAIEMIEILETEPEVLDPIKPEPLRIKSGTIDFNQVNFSHSDADDSIFENLELHIIEGEKVGLVGHSGSGKTTLTRLLLRFSDIDSGSITIGGQNIAAISQDDLHLQIAYVPQEPLLFHRTIAENIGYGKPGATQKEIAQAAYYAHAAEFIDLLPHGYDTIVGERGVKLSGGQRQRVAIARAMLKNARILVLDEATSALDSESEALIQDALWKLMEGRTAIVIAHRLSTIQKMDRIIVLEDGQIVEQGSHKELLNLDGTYAKLWAHQSGGFIEE